MRIDIPLHAHVRCTDGDAGTSKALIVDPAQRRLTHIVVLEHGLADSERIVPIDLVEQTSEDVIGIRCTRDRLHGLDNFIDAHFVDVPDSLGVISEPYESQLFPLVVSRRVPQGEVALGRWAVVEATDGPVGRLGSLVADMADCHITHVIVLTHHLLSRREVAVPVDDVERFYSDYILLRISRRAFEELPHVPFHHGSVLPVVYSADRDLIPEDPQDAGVDYSEPDASRVEGAHLLAEEVRARLSARGFTDEQILDWAKAFLRSQHAGGAVEFLEWISKQEQASNNITESR